MSPRHRRKGKPHPGARDARRPDRPQPEGRAPVEKDASADQSRRAVPEPLLSSLEHLYEISKLLMKFENVEQIVSSILAIVTETLPIRSAILIVEIDGQPRTLVWKAEDLDAEALAAAKAHARVAYGYLVGADIAESLCLEAVRAEASSFLRSVAKDPDSKPEAEDRFILLPLVAGHGPIFGALQVASSSALDEADLMLVNAVVNQLAVAVDRHNAWRHDVAMREHAESLCRQLAEAERRKDEFLALLGHELRNPLAPISTALELLRLHGVRDEQRNRALEMLERQFRHMTRLVDDLLDVSRVTRGTISLQREVIDVATLVAQAVENSDPLIQSHGHELFVDLPRETVCLNADPLRMVQVIANLLANAAKYSERGGRIWLTAAQVGGEVVLRVRDTGIGIAPEMLDEVFQLFTQVAPALARSEGGLGIGLSLVRRLVEMHGGSVEAISAGLGRGSEIVIRLPAVPEALSAALASAPAATAAVGGRGLRVLVVDDNVDSATSLAEVLDVWGHEARVAHDGPSAIDAAAAFHPAVVVLDIGLPGMNGYEVARSLRERYGPTAMALAALTGYGQDRDRQESHDAGFDLHFTKPVDLAVLRRFLDERSALQDSVPGGPAGAPSHGAAD
jgi:signal transduction histidine kinase/ActR/RegA family two-component response regulator